MINTELGDRSQVYILSWYVTSQSRQLSFLLSAEWEISRDQRAVTVFFGWEATVGMASLWPCVWDSAVYLPAGSMASEREMNTRSVFLYEYGTLYLLPQRYHMKSLETAAAAHLQATTTTHHNRFTALFPGLPG